MAQACQVQSVLVIDVKVGRWETTIRVSKDSNHNGFSVDSAISFRQWLQGWHLTLECRSTRLVVFYGVLETLHYIAYQLEMDASRFMHLPQSGGLRLCYGSASLARA
jgi:hypothetical protein